MDKKMVEKTLKEQLRVFSRIEENARGSRCRINSESTTPNF